MNTPYGLEIVKNCTNCKLKRDEWEDYGTVVSDWERKQYLRLW